MAEFPKVALQKKITHLTIINTNLINKYLFILLIKKDVFKLLLER